MISISTDEFLSLRKKVMETDFKRMNNMQKEAVFTTEGPLLVLAGAGSGKTTVLVNRIANIVKYGMAYTSSLVPTNITDEDIKEYRRYIAGEDIAEDVIAKLAVSPCYPWKVMAITFTNKAAGELKERLCARLGDDGNQIWASTFHSSCARMLRRDGDRLGYTNHFTIYDMDDSKRLVKECLKRLNISEKALSPKAVLNEISRAKDTLTSPEEYEKSSGKDFRLQMVSKVYTLYQKQLKKLNAMDFDDLIANTVKLFKECPDVLDYYHNRFRYIMVDEYQDTNHAQYEFVNLLAQGNKNLCVVGDDDQSIYKFRGATIENIMNFEQDYPGAAVIRLEQNYRSTQNILDAANSVIQNNEGRKGKTLWTDNGEGEKIKFHVSENEQDEADRIAKVILDGVSGGRKFSDYAILYRMNSQSLVFERMFAKQGIPHKIIGGTRFYDRMEIRDMIAYLSVVNNPTDEVRFRRIINKPKRGIGERTVDHIVSIAGQEDMTLFEVIAKASQFPVLAKSAKKLKTVYEMFYHFFRLRDNEDSSINDLYKAILEATDYKEYLKSDDPEKAQDRIENVNELSSNIQRYEETEGSQLSGFLEEVSLFTDIDNYDEDADYTVMMTVHSAKGLEFPCVFLPGWEEGIFPGMSVIYNPEEVEEERRLAYVAITRAKEELYIYSAESRMIFGSTNRNKPSRFVEEIPDDFKECSRTREFNSYSVQNRLIQDRERESFAANTYKPRPIKKPAPTGTYKAGDTVGHKTFGEGLILTATTMGNDTLLEIAFDKVGTKKLFANFARLDKI